MRSPGARLVLRFALAWLVTGAACHGERAAEYGSCDLVRVVDGDTIDVRCGAAEPRVRLLRIDTAERGEPGYEAAAKALRRLLGDGVLRLEFEKSDLPVKDAYGRLLAYLLAHEKVVNVEMVRLGWSPFWTKYGRGRLADEFSRAEREARRAQRGIWASSEVQSPSPIAPERLGIAAPCRPRGECCRVCREGVACGDSCISANRTCRRGAGCACDMAGICIE